MSLFARKPSEAPKELVTITIYAADDLMTRGEKLVRAMGFRGAVGGHVLEVYRILQKYQQLDEEAARTRPQP